MAAVRRALPAGDYSVAGLESVVAVERKTLDDFVSTVIHSRARFRRGTPQNWPATGRHASWSRRASLDVLQNRYRGGAHPNAVLGSALSIILDYRIPVFFCSSRQAACQFVQAYLLAHTRGGMHDEGGNRGGAMLPPRHRGNGLLLGPGVQRRAPPHAGRRVS